MQHKIDAYAPQVSPGGLRPRLRYTDIMIWDDVVENMAAVMTAAESGRYDYYSQLIPARDAWIGRCGLHTWEAVQEAVNGTWDDGMQMVEDMVKEIEKIELPVPKSIKRRQEWRDDHGDFDLDRYRVGQPCWRSTAKRELLGQQFITLGVQVGGNGHVSSKDLLWRGALCVALAKVLDEQGYSTEIIAYDYGRGTLQGNRDLLHAVWIKRAEYILDASALVNAVSSWYFRIVNFASYGLVPNQKVDDGLGREEVCPERLLYQITPDPDAWRIREVWSQRDAVELAKTYLARLQPQDEDEFDDIAAEA